MDMSRRFIAVLMAAFLVFATATPANAAQTCQDVAGVGLLCLTVEDGRVTVTGPLGIDLSAEVPPTTIEVPVPGPTQTATVTAPRPAPVTRTAAPTTATVTATETITATETTTATATRTATRTTSSLPDDSSVGQDRPEPDTIVEQVVRNVGVPLLYVLLGIALAIITQFVMYTLGRSDAKHADDKWIESILNRKKR